MLLTSNALVKLSNKKINYFRNLGYNIKKDDSELEIEVNDLSPGSHYKVEVKCDYCGSVREMLYKDYNYGIIKHGKYACVKCADCNREKTNIKKYGVNCYMKTDEFKKKSKETCVIKYNDPNFRNPEKSKKTSIEKYGVVHFSNTEEFKEKCKKSSLEKYGIENQMKSIIFRKKLKEGLKEKFGVENALQNPIIIENMKYNNLSKYGTDNYAKTKECKEKIKKKNLEKYGAEFYLKTKEFKEKSQKSSLKKYGVLHPMQNIKIFEKQQISAFKSKIHKGLFCRGSYEFNFVEKFDGLIKIKKPPSIKYTYNEKNKVYHPDFYLPDYNLIIEIKSSYTYNYNIELNETKKNAVLKNGYDFIFILDENYENFINKINLIK